MKSLLKLVLLFIIWSCSSPPQNSGNKTQRIISLSPHITEIIYALNQQDKLIAVTDYCTYPPEARERESIGGLVNANLEKIVTLNPDILLGVPSHTNFISKFSNQKLNAVLLPNDTIDDILFSIDSLGALLDCKEQSAQLIQSISDSLNYYREKAIAINTSKPRAMLVLGREAGTTRNIGVIGSNNFMDSLWILIGGENIFGDIPMKFSQISREALINKNPDLIVEFKIGQNWDEDKNSRNLLEWENLQILDAVKKKQIYVLTSSYTLIPGPRLYLLAKDFYYIIENHSNIK